MQAIVQCVPKRLLFEVKRQCRTFQFECFKSQMSSFCVVLAEQISINLQYMNRESPSPASRVFALLFKLFKLQ